MLREFEYESEYEARLDQTSRRAASSHHNVIDPRIDVGAQRAILRLRSDPATSGVANAMLASVKTGHLAGIYGDDLLASAQLAARLGTVRWQLVPPGRVAALVREPSPPAPPSIIFRAHARADLANLIPALLEAWNRRHVWAGDPVLIENPHTRRYEWVSRSSLAQWAAAGTLPPSRRVEVPGRPHPLSDPSPLTTVVRTTDIPYRFICYLYLNFGNIGPGGNFLPEPITGSATGLLISPRHVLTAAHCLLTGVAGLDPLGLGLTNPTWVQTVTVTPGRQGDLRPFPSAVVRRLKTQPFRVHHEWRNSGDHNYDFGLITLDAPITDGPGHWSGPKTRTFIRPPVNIQPPNPRLFTAGYPGDRCPPDYALNRRPGGMPRVCEPADVGTGQWGGSGDSVSATDLRISYNLVTTNGQSGSPVWVNQNGDLNLVAIHTRTRQSMAGTDVSGLRITKAVVAALRQWIEADKVKPPPF